MSNSTIILNGMPFTMQLAQTEREHRIGLSKHAGLANDEGMLFLFDKPAMRTFWMSEVRFPIDLVALDPMSRVSKIVEGALPGTMERWSFSKCSAVIEVPAGTCRRVGLKVGHVVTAQEAPASAPLAPPPEDKVPDQDASEPKKDPVVELHAGDRFKVGRFGPTWVVMKTTDGLTGHCQRESHIRKWFGFSFNRDTGEVIVYPVKQSNGDRIGDPVAFGPLNQLDQPDAQPKAAQLLEHHDKTEKVEDHPPHVSTQPGNASFDTPKEEYFTHLYGDALAGEALDVRPALQTKMGAFDDGRETIGTMLEWLEEGLLPHYEGMLRIAEQNLVKASKMGSKTGMERATGDIKNRKQLIDDLKKKIALMKAQPPKQAQIADEEKFVQKVADILASHAQSIQWQPDVLNGGATERAVVTRSLLAQWLGGSAPPSGGAPTPSVGGAAPEASTYILQAASSEQGLRLIGSAMVLAELADFSRLGFSGKQPTLVVYRQAQGKASPEAPIVST